MFIINKIFQSLNYEDYFIKSNLDKVYERSEFKNTNDYDNVYSNVDPDNKTPYLPEFNDLIRLHFLITKFKVIKAFEFGVGHSTSVIAHALRNNEINYSDKLDGIRTDKTFKLHSIDSSRKYINMTRKTVSNELNEYCSFHYSKIKTVLLNDRVTTSIKNYPISDQTLYMLMDQASGMV